MGQTYSTKPPSRKGISFPYPWKFLLSIIIVIAMYYYQFSIIGLFAGRFWETLALIPFFGPALVAVAMGFNLILDWFIVYILTKAILFIPTRIL